ncbi:hypothetical protein ACFL5E_01015 [Candidatus Omnitrophota bacterium]
MFIKKKHILVIVFSSLIISVVLLSTLVGHSLYMQWKKDVFASRYKNSIYKLTAELFKNDVTLSNVHVKTEGEDGKILFEGNLNNNSNKTITSVMIEVYFQEPNGTVLYKDWFYPLGDKRSRAQSFLFGAQQTRSVLLSGEGVSFRHHLMNCPRKVSEELLKKTQFAKSDSKDRMTVHYSIVGLNLS